MLYLEILCGDCSKFPIASGKMQCLRCLRVGRPLLASLPKEAELVPEDKTVRRRLRRRIPLFWQP